MGGCFGSSKTIKRPPKDNGGGQPHPSNPSNSRKVAVKEEELIIAKLKVQADRLDTRLKKLEGEEVKIQNTIKSLVQQGKKEEAYFWLKKLKATRQYAKDSRSKIAFVDSQITSIESTIDDVNFTQMVRDSNKAIENLKQQIDMDEIKLAKELQAEGKMRRQELDALLEDDTDDAKELKHELDMIEKGMIEQAFEEADRKRDALKIQEMNRPAPQAARKYQEPAQQRQAMLA